MSHAQALLEAGRFAEAGRLAAAGLIEDPGDADALNILSCVALASGETDRAVDCARRALTADPQHPGAWVALAAAHGAQGDAHAAVAAARQLVALDPDNWWAHLVLSEMLDSRGTRDADGLVEAREALRLAPNEPDAHTGMGNSLLRRRQYDAARYAFESALALDPVNADARDGLALCTIKRSPETAVRDIADIVGSDPDDDRMVHNLRAALGRVMQFVWIVTFLGSLIAFRVASVMGLRFGSPPQSDSAIRVVFGALAVIVVLILIVRLGRVAGELRGHAAPLASFVLRQDRPLGAMMAVLAVELVLLTTMPFAPSGVWPFYLAGNTFVLLVGAIASITRRVAMSKSKSRL